MMTYEEFRLLVHKHFSLEEIQTICFDLDIDYDDLGGEGKQAKIRELIKFCIRTEQVPVLLKSLKIQRKRVNWPDAQDILGIAEGKGINSDIDINLEPLCLSLQKKYLEISERFTPLAVRKDLKLCPWEPKFIHKNPTDRFLSQAQERVTFDYIDTLCTSQRLVILGEPGTGKSTGLNVAAYKLAGLWLSGEGEQVPIIINLNRYVKAKSRNPRGALIELIHSECNRVLSSGNKPLTIENIKSLLLQQGLLTVFFDGLNEVSATARMSCIHAIIDFCDEFEKCNIVITSRRYMYRGELPFPAMEVLELGREDILGFVEKHSDMETAGSIMNFFSKSKWHLFQNPLALHMMVTVFQETKQIPTNRALLINGYVQILLEKYISLVFRTGVVNVRKEDILNYLAEIAELMSEEGLCLPLARIEQYLWDKNNDIQKHEEVLNLLFDSGLLVLETNSIRFWHHSIQEYFFVFSIYSKFKHSKYNKNQSRKYFREILRKPELWETISLAAGLMSNEEASFFLAECYKKDEYLTAMALHNCNDTKLVELFQQKIIEKCQKVSNISYWLGNVLDWDYTIQLLVFLIVIKQIIRGLGFAFQEVWINFRLPFVDNPWIAEDIIQFVIISVIFITLRRFSDYTVFVRLNTIIRALQHVGTPETRSELMRIFRQFAETARIDLNHLTVIRRVTVSNVCSKEELMNGLKVEDEKLYSIATLSKIAEPTDLAVIAKMVITEKDLHVKEAAIDCMISISNKYPECKEDIGYINALQHATLNNKFSLQSRRKAYAHLVEAKGSVDSEGIYYPTLRPIDKLIKLIFSPLFISYYLVFIFVVFVIFSPQAFSLFRSSIPDINLLASSANFMRLLVVNLYFILIIFLASRMDKILQKLFRNRTNRKWLLLGESTLVDVKDISLKELETYGAEIEDDQNFSNWFEDSNSSSLHKLVSFCLRSGYSVDYEMNDKVVMKMRLISGKSKAQISTIYKFLAGFQFWAYLIYAILYIFQADFLFIALLLVSFAILNTFRLFSWPFINPTLTSTITKVGNKTLIKSTVQHRSKQIPASKLEEAKNIMSRIVAEASIKKV